MERTYRKLYTQEVGLKVCLKWLPAQDGSLLTPHEYIKPTPIDRALPPEELSVDRTASVQQRQRRGIVGTPSLMH